MKKTFFNKLNPTLIIGMVLGVFLTLIVIIPMISSDNIYTQLEKYKNILSLAVKDYFEEVDIVKLNEGAIRGMLKELDPHSSYITAKDMQKAGGVDEEMSGSFEGIGVQFDIVADTLVVEGVISDGPSEKVGIQMRDRVIKVDNNSIIGLTRDSVPKLLRGPKGTIVNLTVVRPGTKGTLDFTITRDKIPLFAINSYFLIPDTDVGYIKLSDYSKPTAHRELVNAGKSLREQGMKKLILDLRGNPGGLLDQA